MAKTCRIAQRRVVLGDPHDCTDAPDQLTILHALFDTLVKRHEQGFVPHLATGWHVSPDALQWEFTLRAGHLFHDGTACDAEAVATSLHRMARPDKGYTLGAPGVWRQYLGDARIDALNDTTLRITLNAPIADLLDILEQAFIVAPSCLEQWDRGETARPVGSGPYRLTGETETSRTATRVAGHFVAAAQETLIWIAEPDAGARLSMLQEGAVDLANDLPTACMHDPDQALSLHEYVSPVAIIYLLNCAAGPLRDARVRRALSLAVDRDSLIADVLNGHARPLIGFVSPNHFGAGPAPDLPHDPEMARDLLAKAGFANGLRLGVDCPTRLPDEAERLTECLKDQLSAVGIALDIHTHGEREDYAHMVRRKEIRDMCVFDSSPMSSFRVLYEKIDSRVAGSWWQGYHNDTVEALLDRAQRETSVIDRADLYAAAYAELQADPAWLTLYNATRVIGFKRPRPGFAMPVDGVIDVTAL